MAACQPKESPVPAPAKDEAFCEEHRRQLGDLLSAVQPDPKREAERHNVILDVELGGTRYILLRFPTTDARAAVQLSPRELEIARMVAKGYPNKLIASVLEISSWTVCTHLRRMFGKLGVTSRAAMVAKLLEEDIQREYTTSSATHMKADEMTLA